MYGSPAIIAFRIIKHHAGQLFIVFTIRDSCMTGINLIGVNKRPRTPKHSVNGTSCRKIPTAVTIAWPREMVEPL